MQDNCDYRLRLPEDEIIYFLLVDRFENGDKTNDHGGLTDDDPGFNDRLVTGLDPTSELHFNGGDLRGVINQLDYIKKLGATAILLSPIFKNRTEWLGSAGYHGYWPLDFENVDPHFGSNEVFKELVDAAHKLGMKIYMDIVVEHTGPVIIYTDKVSGFRNPAKYTGRYNAEIPEKFKHARNPGFLNNIENYICRGPWDSTREGLMKGDPFGLDKLNLAKKDVYNGLIKIYEDWIDKYHIDGFRIDSAKHCTKEFFNRFIPPIIRRAEINNIPNFHIFGEVAMSMPEVDLAARYTRNSKLPYVIDYPFALAVSEIVAGQGRTDLLEELFDDDVLYRGRAKAALRMPTFISNHDRGRFGWYVRQAYRTAKDSDILDRVILANAMMFLLRGVPMIYYGDELGFPGTGTDALAREDMFESQVEIYNKEELIGIETCLKDTKKFDQDYPLYGAIRKLASLRNTQPALRRGKQEPCVTSDEPGLFAVSRTDPTAAHTKKRKLYIAFNTSTVPLTANLATDPDLKHFTPLDVRGKFEDKPIEPGSYRVELKPLDYFVCAAE